MGTRAARDEHRVLILFSKNFTYIVLHGILTYLLSPNGRMSLLYPVSRPGLEHVKKKSNPT